MASRVRFEDLLQVASNGQQLRQLSRAYYRTGQLVEEDRVLVLLFRNGTANHPSPVNVPRTLQAFASEVDLYWTLKPEHVPVIAQLLPAAVAKLTPQQHQLYRLCQFSYVFIESTYNHDDGDPTWSRANLSNNLETNGTGMANLKLPDRVVDGPPKARHAARWRHALAHLTLFSLAAYLDVYPDLEIHQKDLPTRLRDILSKRRLLLHRAAPIVRAYLHLIQALLTNPEYPIEEAMLSSPPFPVIYTTLEVSIPTEHLIPELSTMISGYITVPTFDQVVDRLHLLL